MFRNHKPTTSVRRKYEGISLDSLPITITPLPPRYYTHCPTTLLYDTIVLRSPRVILVQTA